ncbi:Ubiquitin-conjugating enzyme E2 35 [Araneus ventricosus]|uniref:Ubiquitin-conjugating enzyme E2 35 n=1 Tax=Araneus ventricosus TaxID=182803 RepID=A0A4Y2U326_ARAVE|nr:Ubiquitin-conjugating enzyme E2 35 [Araneus ventricosus]
MVIVGSGTEPPVGVYELLDKFPITESELRNRFWLARRNIHFQADPDNPRVFDVTMTGPEHSPYEGMEFELELFVPDNYPLVPPVVRFLTKIKHPQIDDFGYIRSDFLGSRWTPSFGIHLSLLIVLELLREPKDERLSEEAGQCFDMVDEKKQNQVEKICLDFLRLSL